MPTDSDIRILLVDPVLDRRRENLRVLIETDGVTVCGMATDLNRAEWTVQSTSADIIVYTAADLDIPGMIRIIAAHPEIRFVVSGGLPNELQPELQGRVVSAEDPSLIWEDQWNVPKDTRAVTRLTRNISKIHTRSEFSLPASVQVIVIACSTGGPDALEKIFSALKAKPDVPFLIVQHISDGFTDNLARSLDRVGPTRFAVAENGSWPSAGEAVIAPAGQHLIVGGSRRHPRLQLIADSGDTICCPAADPLFSSAAKIFGRSVTAVVLTGMGNDGCAGAAHIHKQGGIVLAQERESCVVWGMPGAVVEAGLATRVISLEELSKALSGNCYTHSIIGEADDH